LNKARFEIGRTGRRRKGDWQETRGRLEGERWHIDWTEACNCWKLLGFFGLKLWTPVDSCPSTNEV